MALLRLGSVGVGLVYPAGFTDGRRDLAVGTICTKYPGPWALLIEQKLDLQRQDRDVC
jgi:hypothetical protein